MYTSRHGRGIAVRTFCSCNSYDTEKIKNVPYIDAATVFSEDESEVTIFVVNRALHDACELTIDMPGYLDYHVSQHIALENDDLKAINTADDPDNVVPVTKNVGGNILLSPHSWNMIVLKR